MRWEFTNVAISHSLSPGLALPGDFIVIESLRFHNGSEAKEIATCHLSIFDAHPDFASLGAFRPDVPDGTVVRCFEMPQLFYEWRSGKLVPAVDEAAINTIDKTIGLGSSILATQASGTLVVSDKGFGWMPIIVKCLSLALVAILAGVLVHLQRRRKSAG
jgi:hypothetical protein